MQKTLSTFICDETNILQMIDNEEGSNTSDKAEVPVNMIWTENNKLTKDTGIDNFANIGPGIIKSLYNFTKNDGTQYFLRNLNTVIQKYNIVTGNFEDIRTTLTNGKRFDYKEYDNWLYMGNGYDDYARWDGTTLTPYAILPKGNILTLFENSIHIAGNISNPSTIYYSTTNDPTSFPSANLIKIPGTDKITGMVKYYDSLIVFKEKSVWKVHYVESPPGIFVAKAEVISENYGCISPKAYCWVENDIWFFTGREVRRVGWLKGGGEGILGFDPTSLSVQIQETLKRCNQTYLSETVVYYNEKKFYLSIPYGSSTYNNLTFVCHLLYKKTWTKIRDRKKANINCFAVYNNGLYQASSNIEGRNYKHTTNYNDVGDVINSSVIFKNIDNKEFLSTSIFRYAMIELKNVFGLCKITLIFDDTEERRKKTKTFYVGVSVDDEENTIGETLIGELLISDGTGESFETLENIKRKFSFLDKAQSFKIGFENSELNGYFTLNKWGVSFKERDKKYISPTLMSYIK